MQRWRLERRSALELDLGTNVRFVGKLLAHCQCNTKVCGLSSSVSRAVRKIFLGSNKEMGGGQYIGAASALLFVSRLKEKEDGHMCQRNLAQGLFSF
jgi:hypothetical protein